MAIQKDVKDQVYRGFKMTWFWKKVAKRFMEDSLLEERQTDEIVYEKIQHC